VMEPSSQTSLQKEEEVEDLDEDPAPPENISMKNILPVVVADITPTTLREAAASDQPLMGIQSMTTRSRTGTAVVGFQQSPTTTTFTTATTEQQQTSKKEGEKSGEVVVRRYENGDVYEGQFLNDKRHGKGEYKFSTGDVYEGQHERGSFKGVGVYRYANGDHYSGQFVAGLFEGQGVFTTSNFKYMGQFVNDKMVCSLVCFVSPPHSPIFFFHKHQCGRGIMIYTDGDRYVGEFKEDMRHGKGTYTSVDGSRYDGCWEEDMRHGWGVLLTSEGIRKEGLWQLGFCLRETNASSSSLNHGVSQIQAEVD
jgi:hypothetical protein